MSLIINGEKRELFGKNASRRLRREGKVPAILYGTKTNTVSLVLNKKDIFTILRSETGENSLVKVTFDAEKRDAMIKELQTDPVTAELLHVDLIQIVMDETLRVNVPVLLQGEAVGVKTEGGFVDFITRDIDVECLPKDIPDHIEVDISELHLHQSIKVEEITPPEDVKFMSDPGDMIVLIQSPAVEKEVEAEEEVEEEVVAQEEEPEVIKKEKAEEEEG